MSSTALRIGSRSSPRTPVPSRASTTIDAFSIPWPRIATSLRTGAWMSVTPCSRTSRSQFRAASRPLGRPSGATNATTTCGACPGEPPCCDEAVATVVARSREDHDRALQPAVRFKGERPGRGRGRRSGLLHELFPGNAQGLRLAIGADHRLGAHRRSGSCGCPARPQAAEIQLEQVGIVRGQRRVGQRRGARAGRSHARKRSPCDRATPNSAERQAGPQRGRRIELDEAIGGQGISVRATVVRS